MNDNSTRPVGADELFCRLAGEADHVDHDVWVEVGDAAGEYAGGVLGLPVGDNPLYCTPGWVIAIRRLLAAADGDDLVSAARPAGSGNSRRGRWHR